MILIRMFLLAACLLLPLTGHALTAYPMKVSVQTGDTLSFTPFIKGWDTTVTSVSADLSTPLHGGVTFICGWFDTVAYFANMEAYHVTYYPRPRTRTPRLFPGFRYIPAAGFTGLDSFTYRIRTSKDSTATATIRVRVTPPEPGNMTVLLVVKQAILASVQAGVDQLKADLEREGYQARILPWTVASSYTVADTRKLWDTLVAEYDLPSRMLAGAILIGQCPIYRVLSGGGYYVEYESAHWCMSGWEPQLLADSVLGYRVGVGGYGRAQYTPGFSNIWVSQMSGVGNGATALGTEAELVNRILQNNHDYRTGASRLPQTAWVYTMYSAPKNFQTLLDVWPAYQHHAANDTTHPFRLEFKKGGEFADFVTHGSLNQYNALLNASNGQVWRYYSADIANTHASIRFLFGDMCHAGQIGGLTNTHLLVKNSGCVLSASSTDYVSCGFFLWDSLNSNFPPHYLTRKYLAAGDRFGRAWLRGNGWKWTVNFHGDLSLKPKMGPPNVKPVLVSVTPVKTGALSWRFTAAASDSDDGITAYDWYGNGYNMGKAAPDSSGPSNTFSITYATAKRCTLRVEAVDHYKARDYATLILKTDSGVIWSDIEGAALAAVLPAHPFLAPNPATGNAVLSFNLERQGRVDIRLTDLQGRAVAVLQSGTMNAGSHRLSLADRPLPSGIYIVNMNLAGRKLSQKITLMH